MTLLCALCSGGTGSFQRSCCKVCLWPVKIPSLYVLTGSEQRIVDPRALRFNQAACTCLKRAVMRQHGTVHLSSGDTNRP